MQGPRRIVQPGGGSLDGWTARTLQVAGLRAICYAVDAMAGGDVGRSRAATVALFVCPLLAAVALRAVYGWWYWRELPFARAPVVDPEVYLRLARELRTGNWRDLELLYHSFLYPYFLALFPVPGPGANLAVMIAQLALGLLNTWLVMRIVESLWDSRPLAAASGLAFGLTSPLLFLETKFYPDTLAITFLLLVLHGLVSPTRPWALGLSTGLLVLVRSEALLYVPIALHRVWRVAELGAARRLAGVIVPIVLCLSIAAVRNSLLVGAFVPAPTVVSGVVFLQGNNPRAQGGYGEPEGFDGMIVNERVTAERLAEQAVGHPLSPVAVDRYWWRKALGYLEASPGWAVRLFGLKLAKYFGAREIMFDLGFYDERDRLPLLRLMLLPFPGLLVLAALGIVADRDRRADRRAVALSLLPSLVVSLVFFVHSRYRVGGLLAVVLLAPGGLVALRALLRAGGARRALAAGLAAAVIATIVWAQILDDAPSERALARYNEGIAWDRLGEQAKALADFRTAFQLGPSHPAVRNNYARALSAVGRRDEAEQLLVEGLAADPESTLMRVSLGWMQLDQGRVAESETQFREAQRRDPADLGAKLGLAFALRERVTDRDAALAVARMFREVADARNVAYIRLALLGLALTDSILQQADDIDPLFGRMAEIQPLSSKEESLWGSALYDVGRYGDARAHQQRAVELDPRNAQAYYGLGLAEQALQHPDAARAGFDRARALGFAFR